MYRFVSFLLLSFVCALPASAECLEDVKAATELALAKAPFRLDWQSEMDGETTNSSAEIVAVNRMRLGPYVMTPDGYFAEGSKISELDGDGKVFFSDVRPQVNVGKGGIANPECLGMTSFEGGEFVTFKFQTEASLLGMMGKAEVSLYVGKDGLPAWLVMNTNVPGVGEAKRRAKYSFDKSITIEAP